MFVLIPQSELSKEHFEAYPIWSEHYDYDEIDEIVSWGIDREWLLQEIRAKCTGSEHCVYPLLQTDPLPARMRIFIKARFQTPDGVILSGFVVNEDAYAMGIFWGNAEYGFNNHPLLRELNKVQEAKLKEAVGYTIFPLKYETDFRNNDGERIRGEFSFGEAPSNNSLNPPPPR